LQNSFQFDVKFITDPVVEWLDTGWLVRAPGRKAILFCAVSRQAIWISSCRTQFIWRRQLKENKNNPNCEREVWNESF